jgi:hypothetical protein
VLDGSDDGGGDAKDDADEDEKTALRLCRRGAKVVTLWLHGPRWRDGRREGAALVVRRDHTHVQWDGGRVLRGGTCVDHGAVPLVMVWPRYSIVISWRTDIWYNMDGISNFRNSVGARAYLEMA